MKKYQFLLILLNGMILIEKVHAKIIVVEHKTVDSGLIQKAIDLSEDGDIIR